MALNFSVHGNELARKTHFTRLTQFGAASVSTRFAFLRAFAISNYAQHRGAQILGRQVGRATKFCTVAPNICGVLSMELAQRHLSGAWNYM